MGAVPVVSTVSGIHLLAVLVVTLIAYTVIAVWSGRIVSAVAASIAVLGTMNASVPLIRGPNRTVDLAIVLGDLAVGCAIIFLAITFLSSRSEHDSAGSELRIRNVLGVPGALLFAFAAWSLIAAPFAVHDVQTAAVFGVNQFRYVIYFAVAAALVATRTVTLSGLSGAFVVAMIGQSLFALVQFLNGEPFGFSYLGETIHPYGPTIEILGQEMMMGRYLGGFVGNNSAYASLAVLAVPLLLYGMLKTNGVRRLLPAAGVLLIGTLCVPLSQYDTGTIAFVATSGAAIVLLCLWSGPKSVRSFVASHRKLALGSGVGLFVVGLAVSLVVGPVRVIDALPLVSSENLAERIANYQAAFEIASQNPITGYGGGNIESVASEVGMVRDVAIHSIFFSFLAETGFVGVALWAGAIVAVAAYAVRAAWSTHPDAPIVSLLCVGGCGLLMIAMLDQIWDNHTTLGMFWIFAGMTVATVHD